MKPVASMFPARIRRVVTLGVATAALSLAVATGTAEAAIGTMSAHLVITDVTTFTQDVTVAGHVPMTPAEAQSLLTSGHKVVFRLWGSDTFDDDLIGGPYGMSARVSSRGLDFTGSVRLSYYYLDEDYGCAVSDEVYAGVRLLNASGSTVRKDETNEIVGNWGCRR